MFGPTTITTKGQVTIPEEVRLLLNAQPGDKAIFTPVPAKKKVVLEVIPTKNVVNKLYGALHRPEMKYIPINIARRSIGPFLAKELGLTKRK